ncbi:MAG: hypothetical protein DRQ01_04585 [Ignavibacteriae bacterium]|nr:MAG: hypothetical protein DRQ01_04585 [Ignavibacteriota bacterium]
MHKVAVIFSRDKENVFSVKVKNKDILFTYDNPIHTINVGDILTISLEIPETLPEILEAKICRSAMS